MPTRAGLRLAAVAEPDDLHELERGEAESRDVAELLRLLDLEELDRDIFRGLNPEGDMRRPRLFGGQVAAQAARAASLTVPDDRRIHSLPGAVGSTGRRSCTSTATVTVARTRPATSPPARTAKSS